MAKRMLVPVVVLSLWIPSVVSAQNQPITQDVYDIWRGILSPTLSPDGKWAAYTDSPTIGEGALVVRSTATSDQFRIPRGYTGRPNNRAGGGASFNPAAPVFSSGSDFVAALVYPTKDVVESASRDRRRAAEANRTSLAIVGLPSGQLVTIPRVRSFTLPTDGGGFIVYQPEPDSSAADSSSRNAAPAARPARSDSAEPKQPVKESGNILVIRKLSDGTEEKILDVTQYRFSDSGRWLAYAVGQADTSVSGLYVKNMESGTVHKLRTGNARYRKLTFDRESSRLSFLEAVADTVAPARAAYSLAHVSLQPRRGAAISAELVVGSEQVGDGMLIPERTNISFTRLGNAILFSFAPSPQDSIPSDSLADKAIYDLWHWNEPRLQTTQALQAAQDRNRSFAAIYHIDSKRYVSISSDSLPLTAQNIQVSDDGKIVLANNSEPYRVAELWGDGGTDVHVIDASNGSSKVIAKKLNGSARLSPDSRFVSWFDKENWFTYEIASGKTRMVTEGITGFNLSQETWSTPSTPAAWGLAGWTSGDRDMLVNDMYDVWVVDPTAVRKPRRLTGGTGRSGQLVFRMIQLDSEARSYDTSSDVLLSAFNKVSKESGWYRVSFSDSIPQRVLMADKRFAGLVKAKNSDRYLVSRSDYREFPDLWSGDRLDALEKISDVMPDQNKYRRGSVRLHNWLSADGDSLSGLLYLPDGFDASKRYPMVVYFYETHSDGLHGYVKPAGRNIVNPTVYNSLGYIVFMPDIKYTDGFPGPSAYKSIVPGVHSLIQAGFVDAGAIGIGGQSWGGYQTAYLVTQTNLFKAAVPNATVVNMTSAYGGIRWGSGLARAFQYETGQSRIGGSLWEYPERYIENSPLFFADRIDTPLLFMANDRDGAVPWYQGIEFFVALRRLGKEAYMVNYNGDEHNPTKRANQHDIDRKMLEFFGHHLLGEPAPEWMKSGIPYIDKGRDQFEGSDIVESAISGGGSRP